MLRACNFGLLWSCFKRELNPRRHVPALHYRFGLETRQIAEMGWGLAWANVMLAIEGTVVCYFNISYSHSYLL